MLFTWILQTLKRLHCKESYDLGKQKFNSLFWSSKWQLLLHWHEEYLPPLIKENLERKFSIFYSIMFLAQKMRPTFLIANQRNKILSWKLNMFPFQRKILDYESLHNNKKKKDIIISLFWKTNKEDKSFKKLQVSLKFHGRRGRQNISQKINILKFWNKTSPFKNKSKTLQVTRTAC